MNPSTYRLIDTDTHVNEPPGLWIERVPAKYRELVPRVERFQPGRARGMEGVDHPINFGLIPNRGIEQAVDEIERVAQMRGIVGLLVGCYPHGDTDLAPEDDAVWQAAVTSGLPLHVHVKLVNEHPQDIYAPGRMTQGRAEGDLRFLQAPLIMVQ